MRSYRQFCPVAKASEVLTERWTLLILRELLMGSHRFNDLERGVPGIPRSLLAQRLRMLERAEIVERRPARAGRGSEYYLTQAGEEVLPIVEQLGVWGQRWVNAEVREFELDPSLLVWDMRRRIALDRVPARRIVVQLAFRGARRERYWLVLDRGEVSICREDFGFDVDLHVTADTLALHRVWIGRLALADALRDGLIELDGPSELTRGFPNWIMLSTFASIPPATAPTATTASVAAPA
jgi:DNA-binding HxlR family transcriptional regulator